MNYANAISEIKSVRDYKNKEIQKSDLMEILKAGELEKKPMNSNIKVEYIENGKEFFDEMNGKLGYSGKLIQAPHYLLVVGEKTPQSLVDAGYILENMRLQAYELGIGSCWLHLSEEDQDTNILAGASLGYPYTGWFKKDIQEKASREAMKDLVYLNSWNTEMPTEDYYNLGLGDALYLVRFAPSWGNLQPWKFIYRDGRIYIPFEKHQEHDFNLELGIIMLYIEKTFRYEGLKNINLNDVNLLEAASEMAIPDHYEIRAIYEL